MRRIQPQVGQWFLNEDENPCVLLRQLEGPIPQHVDVWEYYNLVEKGVFQIELGEDEGPVARVVEVEARWHPTGAVLV